MSDVFGKATHADAELVLKLYEMRREQVMRDARKFIGSFNPQSADEIIALIQAQTQENAYFRQVTSFWEMAAALVHHGTLHEGLFLDTQGEMFFVFAKLAPYLAEVREKLENPNLMAQTEKLINHTEIGQQKLAAFTERLKKMAARRAQTQAAKQ